MIDTNLKGLDRKYVNTHIGPVKKLIDNCIEHNDWHKVFALLSIASKMGCIEASIIIASYLFGRCKYNESYKYALLAHDKKHSQGTLIMGICELKLGKNRRGVYHLQKAGELGNKNAMEILLKLYMNTDSNKVTYYIARLIDCYPAEYCLYLGCFYIKTNVLHEAIKYLKISANHNCSIAYCLLGICDLLIYDYPGKKCKKYLKKSKDMGNMEGTYFYGMYMKFSIWLSYKAHYYKKMARNNGVTYKTSCIVNMFRGTILNDQFVEVFDLNS